MKSFNWGILGTGGIAQAFVDDLSRVEGHHVVAIGSRSIDKAERFAKPISGATADGNYSELVADKKVDAIYVATPHPMH